MKKFSLTICLLLCLTFAYSQKWVDMMQDPNANYYDIKKELNNKYQIEGGAKLL